MIHDAEDLIHPEELRWINYYAARYDFVQTPVLALATPLRKLTHGVYCDEFAENHTRDMTVRAILGGFVPSCGVGTGYRRDALERLARASSNRLFEPEALTEDYENGLRLFRLGCSQAFVPISKSSSGGRDFVVTREFFPATLGRRAAAADALGHGHRAARLAAVWLVGETWGSLLAVAGSQGSDRESAQPGGQSGVRVRTGDGDVDARIAGASAPGDGHDGSADRPHRRPGAVRRPHLRIRIRAGRSGARRVCQRAEYRRDGAGRGAIHFGARARAAAQMAQDRARLPGARGAARAKAQAGRDPGQLRLRAGGRAGFGPGGADSGNPAGRVSGRLAQAGDGRAVSGAQFSAGPSPRAGRTGGRAVAGGARAAGTCHPPVASASLPHRGAESVCRFSRSARSRNDARPCERSLRSKSAFTW